MRAGRGPSLPVIVCSSLGWAIHLSSGAVMSVGRRSTEFSSGICFTSAFSFHTRHYSVLAMGKRKAADIPVPHSGAKKHKKRSSGK
ncbi:hypothetical protein NDU88_003797 [Pleurodeles waltl]|uniref:Secreted protein n=1 Tax=Pleurodeles waltl TaxID=8319 RepID=A0AAV7NHN8_PLEWA|nr:hypothetical protein NDU88_003797 [Pleurodeles waltl]